MTILARMSPALLWASFRLHLAERLAQPADARLCEDAGLRRQAGEPTHLSPLVQAWLR